jgi:Cdc6-like AAA superfamily ATPase
VANEKGVNYQINAAFLGVQRRAESVDRETLVQTFVDIGALFTVLSSRDRQIVYGRRGTGKTHALLYLGEQAKKDQAIPVYIDLRYIGSSGGLYGDTPCPFHNAQLDFF